MTAIPRQRGFTLIELMLSATLGLLLLIGIGSLFLQSNRSNRQNELIAGLQDQGRFALATLSRDLAMTGYWGGVYSSVSIAPNTLDLDVTNDTTSANTALPAASDCGASLTSGWAFDLTRRLEFLNNTSSTAAAARWRCIGNQLAGTDVVSLRHVAGQATATMASSATTVTLRPYNTYLQTNGTDGSVMRWGAAATAGTDTSIKPLNPPMVFYRYVPRIYFVRDYSRTPGDRVPALCRKEICPSRYKAGAGAEAATCGDSSAAASTTGIYSECIADGVEDLQLSWGLDTDGDGITDRYTSTPSDNEMRSQAVVAQVSLLIRSRRGDPSYTDDKTYLLGDKAAYAPGGVTDPAGTAEDLKTKHFYRRVFSTTVQLRNPVN